MYLNYTNDRLQELINIIDDIRITELSYNYYDDMTLLEKDDYNGT